MLIWPNSTLIWPPADGLLHDVVTVEKSTGTMLPTSSGKKKNNLTKQLFQTGIRS